MRSRRSREDGFEDFARAIMTTDTRPKIASATFKAGRRRSDDRGLREGRRDDLAEDGDDARLSRDRRRGRAARAQAHRSRRALPHSFNAITVDGDMSTNDTLILMASGAAANRALGARDLAAFDRRGRRRSRRRSRANWCATARARPSW